MSAGPADTGTVRRSPRARRVVLASAVLVVVVVVAFGVRRLWAKANRDEGLQLAQAGRRDEAEPLLERALARDDRDVEVVAALALAKLGGKEPAAAEEYLTRWCELAPHEARPYRLRMDLRHRIARGKATQADRLRVTELAAEDGRHALEIDPDDDLLRREVARLLLQVGRFDEAEQACRRCLMRAPADAGVLYLLAKACHGQGKRAEAEAALDAAAGGQAPSAEALLLRGILHREAGQPDRAVPLLRKALGLPGYPRKDALYELGLALAAADQGEEAKRVMAELDLVTLEEAIRDKFPATPAMRVQMADAVLRAGRAEEARARLEAVVAEAPDFAPAHRVLALYYEQKGQPERAAEHRRRAVVSDR
jgi:Tfp pilus assembly protein PilF